MDVPKTYERDLGQRFMEGLSDNVTVYGLQTMEGRVPTFLLNVDGVEAATVATTMAERGYGVWAHDSWYSLGLREKLPYPKDAVRVGFIHYNTVEEVERSGADLASLSEGRPPASMRPRVAASMSPPLTMHTTLPSPASPRRAAASAS